MRYSVYATLVLLLVMLLPVESAASGGMDAGGGFLSWAKRVSSELDTRWSTISSRGGYSCDPTPYSGPRSKQRTPGNGSGVYRTGKLRTSILVSRDFVRSGKNIPFLPLSTRKRNSPSRGTGALGNPSRARLRVAYKRLRPVKSFTTEKRFFGARKSFVRPKLRANRRISLSRYRSGRGAVRPAYRASRPRRFKSVF